MTNKFRQSPLTTKSNGRNICLDYKWSKFVLLGGHSDENKPRRNFEQRNDIPPKNSRSTVFKKVNIRSNDLYIEQCNKMHIPYFLKYSRSKIFAVEHTLCISEIIRASKFRG